MSGYQHVSTFRFWAPLIALGIILLTLMSAGQSALVLHLDKTVVNECSRGIAREIVAWGKLVDHVETMPRAQPAALSPLKECKALSSWVAMGRIDFDETEFIDVCMSPLK